MASTHVRSALKSAAGALGLAAGAYAGYVVMTWLRYGHSAPAGADDVDPLLDQFMPVYEVAERLHVHVAAPADITFAAAGEQDLMALPMVPDARTHQEPPRRSMDAARSRAVQRRR
jgi:hypothetical protein